MGTALDFDAEIAYIKEIDAREQQARCSKYAEYQTAGVGCKLYKGHEGPCTGDDLDLLRYKATTIVDVCSHCDADFISCQCHDCREGAVHSRCCHARGREKTVERMIR